MKLSDIKIDDEVAIGSVSDLENRTVTRARIATIGTWNRDWKFSFKNCPDVWVSHDVPKTNIGVHILRSDGSAYPSVVKCTQILCRWVDYLAVPPTEDNRGQYTKELRKCRAILAKYAAWLERNGIASSVYTPFQGLPTGLILDHQALKKLYDKVNGE